MKFIIIILNNFDTSTFTLYSFLSPYQMIGTPVIDWLICNVWLKIVSWGQNKCCFHVFFFWFLRWWCKVFYDLLLPLTFSNSKWTGLQDRKASHIHKHTQEGSTTHLNDGLCDGGSLCVCEFMCVCGNDVMLAGLSVENSSFAVWEAFVFLCRQCCYACRNVSLRINVGILSSNRREREIDQSPPQSQPALQPKRLDYQESFETSPFVHSMLVMISFWSMQGRLSLSVEHHQPSSLAHYTAATDKHPVAYFCSATNGCVRAAVLMLLEACKIIVMYSVWICPFLLRSYSGVYNFVPDSNVLFECFWACSGCRGRQCLAHA